MAETEDLELDEAKKENKQGGGHKKIIIIVTIVGVILLGVVVGVTLVFTGAFEGSGTEEISADWDDEEAEVVEKDEEAAAGERAEVLEAFYLDLEPEFVVNLEDTSHASFLSANIQLMARDDEILEVVEAHMPVVRNHILSILASQPYEKLISRKGKQQLRGEILKGIQRIVAQGGDRPAEVGEEGEGEEGEGEEDEDEENEDEENEDEYSVGEEDGNEEDEGAGSEDEEGEGGESEEGEGEGVPEVSNNVAAVYFTSFIMQ